MGADALRRGTRWARPRVAFRGRPFCSGRGLHERASARRRGSVVACAGGALLLIRHSWQRHSAASTLSAAPSASGQQPGRAVARLDDLGGGLRAVRVHRAVARDRLVPHPRRHPEVELVHVRPPAGDVSRRRRPRRARRHHAAGRGLAAGSGLLCAAGGDLRCTRRLARRVSSLVDRIDVRRPALGVPGRYRTADAGDILASPASSCSCTAWFRRAHRRPPTLHDGPELRLLQRAVQTDLATLGRRVGWLQTANIVGSMVGAMVTGLVLLDGSARPGTLRLLCCLPACLPDWAAWRAPRVPGGRRDRAGRGRRRWCTSSRCHPRNRCGLGCTARRPRSIQREDGSGLSLKTATARRADRALRQRPRPEHAAVRRRAHDARRPAGAASIRRRRGRRHRPRLGRHAVRRRRPAGDQTIDSIEIIAPELGARASMGHYPALGAAAQDAARPQHFTDGADPDRARAERYDIIEADALRPPAPTPATSIRSSISSCCGSA